MRWTNIGLRTFDSRDCTRPFCSLTGNISSKTDGERQGTVRAHLPHKVKVSRIKSVCILAIKRMCYNAVKRAQTPRIPSGFVYIRHACPYQELDCIQLDDL